MRSDLVVHHAAVFDGRRLLPDVDAVAVTDGRVTALGSAAELRGTARHEVDAEGGLLQPGFIDAHIHPIEAGLERMRCDLSEATTSTDYLALVRSYADSHPEEPWILGGGWQLAAFPGGMPTREQLDAVVDDRPVFLANRDHHGAWVNSRALEIAGLGPDSPEPTDGRVERDADGRPTGMLQEGATSLVQSCAPPDTDDDLLAGLLEAQRHLHSLGIVGWQDAIVGDYFNHSDTSAVYLRAAERGDLTSSVVGALWWDRARGAEQIGELEYRRAAAQHPKFRATSVKIMQDGIPENRTAAMLDPYLTGCRCGGEERGLSFVDPVELRGHVAALDALGFQVHFHAIGDRAVREALDALEVARQCNAGADNRHHIAHVQIVHPDDVRRFAALGVAVNMQALWATYEPQMVELNLPLLGDERASWQYPFGDLWRSGARFCAGSDWPVTTPDPWAALHVAVNRQLPASDPEHHPEPFFPRQALALGQALAAYTSGSGWINHREHAIAPGLPADLVLLDRNPLARPVDEIAETRTLATWVDGVEVFRA